MSNLKLAAFACSLISFAGLTSGQTVMENFDNPGSIGSSFLLWNNKNTKCAYSESTENGIGKPSSGSLAVTNMAPGAADSTLVNSTAFNFSTAPVGTFYIQNINFKLTAAASGTAQRVVQVGFINENNSGFLGNNESNQGQSSPSFISLRISSTSTANPSSFNIQSQYKQLTNSAAVTVHTSGNFVLNPAVWYRFSVATTNIGSGMFSLFGSVESLGGEGTESPTVVFSYGPLTLTNTDLALDEQVFPGFRSTTGTGVGYLDEFRAIAFPSQGPGISLPQIIPSLSSIYSGTPFKLNVSTSGSGPISYRWQVSYNEGAFVDLAGANSSQYDSPQGAFLPPGHFRYRVIASNSSGSTTSAPSATLNMLRPSAPILTLRTTPQTATSVVGGKAVFCAAFDGTKPLSYQWRFSTDQNHYSIIPGATNSSLFLSNLTAADVGYYSLCVSNSVSGSQTVVSGDSQLTLSQEPLPSSLSMSNAVGIGVSVRSNGTYSISSSRLNWSFDGKTESSPYCLTRSQGQDNMGNYAEISFGCLVDEDPRLESIRLYEDKPVVLFSTVCLSDTVNNLSFPRFTSYPTNLYHVNYSGCFGIYSFSKFDPESPWLFFDTNYNSFMLSSATNYMIANNLQQDSTLGCGINPEIRQLPAGFTHKAVLVIENGINNTFDTWGSVLTSLSGKKRPANDGALELKKLGYWTDNGATYYYTYNSTYGYTGTMLAIRDEFARLGLNLGYLQLDSWWYPKGVRSSWQGDPINMRGGYTKYTADPILFPVGLNAFQQELGLPLVTHYRWIDPSSSYLNQYAMSGNVSVDPAFWTNLMGYISSAGVVTFEQDWLNAKALPMMNLSDPSAFMDNMQAAAASNKVNMQYCMPLPRHYLQGSLYDNLLTIRVSNDAFEIGKWDEFLYDSRLALSSGAWPWVDVFFSTQTRNLLISTLSAGPVGVGDALGNVNVANLLKSVRQDSVIVKPDTSLVPLDQSYLNDAQGLGMPMVSAAYTDHNGMRSAYVFAYARNATKTSAAFTPAQMGFSGSTFVYDYFNQTGSLVPAGGTFNFTAATKSNTSGGNYFVVTPVAASGIALLGDAGKFVTLGRQRVAALSDSGVLWAKVLFASGETQLTFTGYAPSAPYASVDGISVPVNYNSATRLFTVNVNAGSAEGALLALSLTPLPSIAALPPLQGKIVNGQYQISWPSSLKGYVIERADTLVHPINWVPVTNRIDHLDSENAIYVMPAGQSAFYRLRQ